MVEALTRHDIPSARYAIGGPEALVGEEVAERLSRVMGRPVTFNSLTSDEFASGMSLLVTGSQRLSRIRFMTGWRAFIVSTTISPFRP